MFVSGWVRVASGDADMRDCVVEPKLPKEPKAKKKKEKPAKTEKPKGNCNLLYHHDIIKN
jgi:hypothetical protein